MQIIPVVSESGTSYMVRKKRLFGRAYLCEGGNMLTLDDHLMYIFKPMRFGSPKLAAEEIKKQFGETAKIHRWEPK